MIITYYGASCFKAQSGETVLAFDPPSKEFPAKDFGLKIPRFQADVVLISHSQHKDHNGYDTLSGKRENERPFVIDGPGEYEIKGIQIAGIKSFHDDASGEKMGLNTIYSLVFEDISICHMGDFGEKELRPETKEAIGKVDILFIPIVAGVAGEPKEFFSISQKAAQIASQIEPKIIIPMHYHKDKKALKKFLEEFGNGAVKPVEKLTIKKRDLGERKTEVVVLSCV